MYGNMIGSTTPRNGPLNRTALWNNSITDNIWVGFSVCLSGITESKTYYVGIAGDNEFRLVLDGSTIVNSKGTFTFNGVSPI
jgi:uncharacterized Zn finger protein